MSFYGFLVFFILLVAAFLLYDRVLRTLVFQFPEIWEKENSPIGMFWFPPNGKTFSGSFARNWFMLKLLFKNPDWAKSDRTTLNCLWAYRICVFSGWAICFSNFGFFLR